MGLILDQVDANTIAIHILAIAMIVHITRTNDN